MADQAGDGPVVVRCRSTRWSASPSKGGGDQYEKSLPILEALIDGGHDKAELPVWGVLAAVCCNEFDLADNFAKIAIDTGAVGATPDDTDEAKATFAQAISYLQEKDRYRARWEAEREIREQEAAADDNPRVKLTLGKEGAPTGEVVIELFEDQAPTATANFLSLVKKGFYENVPFHRVLPRFMAQGGDPDRSRHRRAGLQHRLRVLPGRLPKALPRHAQHGPRGAGHGRLPVSSSASSRPTSSTAGTRPSAGSPKGSRRSARSRCSIPTRAARRPNGSSRPKCCGIARTTTSFEKLPGR